MKRFDSIEQIMKMWHVSKGTLSMIAHNSTTLHYTERSSENKMIWYRDNSDDAIKHQGSAIFVYNFQTSDLDT